MKKNRFSFILCLIIISCSWSIAQDRNNLWLSAGFNKTLIKKKLDFEFSSGMRGTALGFSKFLLQPALTYKISKKIDLLGSYRFTILEERKENRISLGAKWNDKIIKRTYLSIKYRHQVESFKTADFLENTSRIKTVLKHKIKKTKLYPYLYQELFYELNPGEFGFSKLRLGGGMILKSLKRQDIKLNYFRSIDFEKPFSGKNIFSINYSYSFK